MWRNVVLQTDPEFRINPRSNMERMRIFTFKEFVFVPPKLIFSQSESVLRNSQSASSTSPSKQTTKIPITLLTVVEISLRLWDAFVVLPPPYNQKTCIGFLSSCSSRPSCSARPPPSCPQSSSPRRLRPPPPPSKTSSAR